MQPTEVQGPGDIMTHNEAIRARERESSTSISSLPSTCSENIAADAGHQRQSAVHESWRSTPTGNYNTPKNGQAQSLDSTDNNGQDREASLYEPVQMLHTPAVGLRSHTPGTFKSIGHRRGNKTAAALSREPEKSPSPPKRSYRALSTDLPSDTPSSPSDLATRDPAVKGDVLLKKRRLVKQESVRNLLSAIPQYVPLPPTLMSPLRSTR